MRIPALISFVILCSLVLLSGCMQPETQVTPIAPTPTPAVPPPDLIPGPTDTVPAEYRILVTVTRGTFSPNPVIRVEFRGGQGMRLVSSLDAEVIRADGTIGTASMNTPAIGDFVEVTGTSAKDRVIVSARMMNGERFRIYDQVLEFRA